MSIIIIAQRKIIPLRISNPFYQARELFFVFNEKGIVTIAALFIVVISLIGYLAALYFTFQLGFMIQGASLRLSKLTDETTRIEFSLRQKEVSFAEENKNLLESMEKITAVKYLNTDSTISFYTPTAE